MDAVSTANAPEPEQDPAVTEETTVAGSPPQYTDLVGSFWRFLLNPAVLISAAALVLLFVIAAVTLPQIPGQLLNEPAATARWTLTTEADYGPFGGLLRWLGLFDVQNSLLFRLLLAALSLVVAVRFADRVGAASAYWRTKRLFSEAITHEAPVLDLITPAARYRRRFTTDLAGEATFSALREMLSDRYASLAEIRFAPLNIDSTNQGTQLDESVLSESISSLLAEHNAVSYYLRPTLPLGLLVVLTVMWLFLLFGWELSTPTIAAGDTYTASVHGLTVDYQAPEVDVGSDPVASVSILFDGGAITHTVTAKSATRSGASRIVIDEAAPGLLIRVADGSAILSDPGNSDATNQVGIVFPSPGSEESVLIPTLSSGLRIVRRSDEPYEFIAELYQGTDLLPQQRIEVREQTFTEIESEAGSTILEFLPLPGIDVTIRNVPALWLLWPAIAFFLIGLYSVIRPPSLALSTVTPWPVDRTLVTLQSDREKYLEQLESALERSSNAVAGNDVTVAASAQPTT